MEGSEYFLAVGEGSSLAAFGRLGAYLLGGMLFALFGLVVARLLAPSQPYPEKLTTYECGEDPIGEAGVQLHMRFYLPALLFLVFEVEMILIFPWAVVFAKPEWIATAPAWGWLAFGEMVLFSLILLLGLAYAWQRGDLDAARPQPFVAEPDQRAAARYQVVNERYAGSTVPQK